MFYKLLVVWFQFVLQWHYAGVVLLMALESTAFPIPSEIIIPPAAYWASLGQMNFWGVVLAGTIGSYLGSAASYLFAHKIGRPFLLKFGKYFFLTPEKLAFAERWVRQYGTMGIFLARMLPVARHLISLPAGFLRMNFGRFSAATLGGSALWCLVLAWFGQAVIGDQPALLENPANLVHVLKGKLMYVVAAVIGFGGLYFWVRYQKAKWAVKQG